MSTSLFIKFAVAFILLTLLFSVGEMIWIDTEGTPLFIVLHPASNAAAWFPALVDIITFKYTFFSGSWIIARWILFASVSAGFMIGLVITLAQGVMSALGGLFRMIGVR